MNKHHILKKGFAILLLFSFQSAPSQEPAWMKKAQWLLGTWEGRSKGESFMKFGSGKMTLFSLMSA